MALERTLSYSVDCLRRAHFVLIKQLFALGKLLFICGEV